VTDFSIEKSIDGPVIGLDEVGRGPLAGPVVSCGCYFSNYDDLESEIPITDSKKHTAKQREKLFIFFFFSFFLKLLIEKSNSKLYPSRILNLGVYILISNSEDHKEKNESETNKIISDIFEKLSLSANKSEKDIGIYKSSISKMQQAKELIEELRTKEKKKEQKK